jgi:hypothetical protein
LRVADVPRRQLHHPKMKTCRLIFGINLQRCRELLFRLRKLFALRQQPSPVD